MTLASVAPMAGLSVSAASAAVIPLTPDLAESTASFYSGSVAGVINDTFAYDANSPTSPLPTQTYGAGIGFHAGTLPNRVSVLFDDSYDQLFIDLYGRNSDLERDDNLTITFYNGAWTAGAVTQTITGFSIPDAAPYYGRATASTSTIADRVTISGSNTFFTLMEMRANGVVVPEPTALAFLGIGAMGLRRRKCPHQVHGF